MAAKESVNGQRIRLGAGMLAKYVKQRDGESLRIPCLEVDVVKLARRMTPEERAELTAEVDWLVEYEEGEELACHAQ